MKGQLALEIPYVLLFIYYLCTLKHLNDELKQFGDGATDKVSWAIRVMSYGNNAATSYLIGGIILAIIGALLIFILYKFAQYSDEPIVAYCIVAISLVVLFVLYILLWVEIQNPIVKAMIILSGVGTAFIFYSEGN